MQLDSRSFLRLISGAAMCCAVLTTPLARAADALPKLVPLEEIRRAPVVSFLRLSPDGKQMALLKAVNRQGTIFLAPASGEPLTPVYTSPKLNISGVIEWSRDGRYLIYLLDRDGDEVFHLFRLDTTKNGPQTPVDLTPYEGVQVELLARPTQAPDFVLIGMNKRDRSLQDAYRLNLTSGELELGATNTGPLSNFLADDKGRVLAATSIGDDGSLHVVARSDERADWRKVLSVDNAHDLVLLGLDAAGRRAYVRTNRDTDTSQLYTLNLQTGALSSLGSHKCGRFDAGVLFFDGAGKPIAQDCVAERGHVFTNDGQLQKSLDALTGAEGSVAIESIADNQSTWVFHLDGPQNPGQLVRYDVRNKRMQVLYEQRPWLKDNPAIGKRHAWVNARDGLPLQVYYSEPPDRADKPGPTVVVVHGGPWSRDVPFFESEIALLVNRGYKTLQVNYRGSWGLGRKHSEAAIGQFGKAMSDDLEDVLDWAVQQGMTDPTRVCILGGSYGGYATLIALTRGNGRFACGVDYAGPSDLVVLTESFPPYWRPFMPRRWFRFVGNPAVAEDRKRMLEVSAMSHIDRINRPLLIFQGANDPRVTQVQAETLVASLRSRGMPVVYLLARDEGHGFGNNHTMMAVSRATELFLAEYLGGRAQAAVPRYVLETQLKLQVEPN